MAISKVILNNETLMDVTSDTVTAETLASGETATASSGEKITGNLIPDSQEDLIKANNNTLTSFSNSTISTIRGYMFFSNTALTSIDLPNVSQINGSAFYRAGLSGDVKIEKYLALGNQAFRECPLTTITFKGGVNRLDTSVFEKCQSLTGIDIGHHAGNTNGINGGSFYNTQALSVFIIRKTDSVFPLNSSFPSTCGLYSAGTIYVPDSLVASYKAATGWANYASRITKIEGTTYETHWVNGEAIS